MASLSPTGVLCATGLWPQAAVLLPLSSECRLTGDRQFRGEASSCCAFDCRLFLSVLPWLHSSRGSSSSPEGCNTTVVVVQLGESATREPKDVDDEETFALEVSEVVRPNPASALPSPMLAGCSCGGCFGTICSPWPAALQLLSVAVPSNGTVEVEGSMSGAGGEAEPSAATPRCSSSGVLLPADPQRRRCQRRVPAAAAGLLTSAQCPCCAPGIMDGIVAEGGGGASRDRARLRPAGAATTLAASATATATTASSSGARVGGSGGGTLDIAVPRTGAGGALRWRRWQPGSAGTCAVRASRRLPRTSAAPPQGASCPARSAAARCSRPASLDIHSAKNCRAERAAGGERPAAVTSAASTARAPGKAAIMGARRWRFQ